MDKHQVYRRIIESLATFTRLNRVIEDSSIAETARLNAEAERDELRSVLDDALERAGRYREALVEIEDFLRRNYHSDNRGAAIARAALEGEQK